MCRLQLQLLRKIWITVTWASYGHTVNQPSPLPPPLPLFLAPPPLLPLSSILSLAHRCQLINKERSVAWVASFLRGVRGLGGSALHL